MRKTPWVSGPAMEFFDSKIRPWLKKDKTMAFEWGVGGTTVWLHDKVKGLITIEHDPRWARKAIEENPEACKNLRVVALGRTYPMQISGPKDLIVIDGRMRVDCAKKAIPHLREGGWLIVDNTDRPRYASIFTMVPKTWERWRIYGLADGGYCETTFFRRSDATQ